MAMAVNNVLGRIWKEAYLRVQLYRYYLPFASTGRRKLPEIPPSQE
jgi:hypothetical protein